MYTRDARKKEVYKFLREFEMVGFQEFQKAFEESSAQLHPVVIPLCPSVSLVGGTTLWVGDDYVEFSSLEDAFAGYKIAYRGIVSSLNQLLSGLDHEFVYSHPK